MEVLDVKASNKEEELIRIKKLLESKEDVDLLQQLLKRLDEFQVTYEDLFNTKIGKTLKKLTKNKDKSISTQANKLIDKWKKLIKKSNPEEEKEMELKKTNSSNLGDLKLKSKSSTSSIRAELSKEFIELNKRFMDKLNNSSHPPIRNSVRKILYEAFVNKEETDESTLRRFKQLVDDIEATIFELLYKADDKGAKYVARAKAIASNLQDRNNPDFRTAVMEGSYTPKEITLMDVKKMASSELQTKRMIAEKEAFNSIRSDWHDVHAPVGVGMYTCENCKSQRTTSKEIQLRGADEPMTLFLRCVDCGNEWRIG